MRVFSRLESEHAAHKIAIRPQVEGMIDLEAFGGGSTAPAAQKALRFLSVTQTNARPAVRLIANGDWIGQSGGLLCVHRNLVCTCARGQGSQELFKLPASMLGIEEKYRKENGFSGSPELKSLLCRFQH